jgi:hypothetical protein
MVCSGINGINTDGVGAQLSQVGNVSLAGGGISERVDIVGGSVGS